MYALLPLFFTLYFVPVSAGYSGNYGNPEAGYAGNPYPVSYGGNPMNPVSFLMVLISYSHSLIEIHTQNM